MNYDNVHGIADSEGNVHTGPVTAKMYLSSDQSIVSNNNVLVEFDTSVFDTTGSICDTSNHKLIIPENGKYLVVACARFDSLGDDILVNNQLKINGTTKAQSAIRTSATGDYTSLPILAILDLNTNDEITLTVYQNSVGTKDIDGHDYATHIEIAKVG